MPARAALIEDINATERRSPTSEGGEKTSAPAARVASSSMEALSFDWTGPRASRPFAIGATAARAATHRVGIRFKKWARAPKGRSPAMRREAGDASPSCAAPTTCTTQRRVDTTRLCNLVHQIRTLTHTPAAPRFRRRRPPGRRGQRQSQQPPIGQGAGQQLPARRQRCTSSQQQRRMTPNQGTTHIQRLADSKTGHRLPMADEVNRFAATSHNQRPGPRLLTSICTQLQRPPTTCQSTCARSTQAEQAVNGQTINQPPRNPTPPATPATAALRRREAQKASTVPTCRVLEDYHFDASTIGRLEST